MVDKVFITSIGIVSALGKGVEEHRTALYNEQPQLRKPKHLKTIHADEFVLGELDHSDDELSSLLGITNNDQAYTRTALLSMLSMKELLADVDIDQLNEAPYAFINANTVGGMSSVELVYEDFISDKTEGDFLKYIETIDCAESTMTTAKHYGLKPLMGTVSTACSSSANAILLGARMIKHGIVKRAICGGCDALSKFTINGFNSLKNVSKQPCMPFDNDRVGLNLGEGAGYVLLESEKAMKERGAEPIAVLSGYGNTNDAHHPTAPSPNGDGAYNTMMQALNKAGLGPEDIGYINAHGTATFNNDSAEGKAIERVFEATNTPPFSSTKPYTGHTLAAAGVIEAVFSILALQEQRTLPNLNFRTQMEELSISPTTTIDTIATNHVLSNSFGFGGNNVSLILSKA